MIYGDTSTPIVAAEVVDSKVCWCDSVSVSTRDRSRFQARSLNHSDISPFKWNRQFSGIGGVQPACAQIVPTSDFSVCRLPAVLSLEFEPLLLPLLDDRFERPSLCRHSDCVVVGLVADGG